MNKEFFSLFNPSDTPSTTHSIYSIRLSWLIYNLHKMKCTNFKYTVRWLLTKYIHPYFHHTIKIENISIFLCPLKVILLNAWPQTLILLLLYIIYCTLHFYTNRVIKYGFLCVPFSQHNASETDECYCVLVVTSFLLLSSILVHGYTINCLSIYQLKDIWSVSSFTLLWIKLP